MSVKRKISVRKIMQALLTMVLTGVCIVAVTSATKTQKARTLKKIEIQIKNKQYGFVTEADIEKMLLDDKAVQLNSTKLSKVNVQHMERVVTANPWIEEAQVYVDNNHTLHAMVTQRTPVVRIFEKNGNSYYIDKRMEPLPLSAKYNYYTTVVTNVPVLSNDSAGNALKGQIMTMVKFIREDSFWNAQVSQLIVRDDLGFEIVPVLGNHQVILGDTTNMKKKFDNLFTFYNNVLNEVGWDKYQVLDLSYNGQLVAAPSLNWKMPVDKVINRINWVNSILEDDKAVSRHIARPVKLAVVDAPETPKAQPAKEVKSIAESTTEKVPVTNVVVKPEVKKEPSVKTEAAPVKVRVAEVKRKEVKKAVRPAPKKVVPKASPKETKPKPEKKVEETKHKKEDKKPKYIYNG